jgi:hypothetical protein
VLLVLGGSGRALLRAVAVSDALVLDEAELKPGGWAGPGGACARVGGCRARAHVHAPDCTEQRS